MKKILGLDIGTNSIGWALIEQDFENKQGKILGLGSRIIPMAQDALGEFESGAPIKTQTAERTRLRLTRRLRERHLLRRERLHRVLNVLGFLPAHYANKIDFDARLGKFLPETEVKLVYDDNCDFIFRESFEKMLADFREHQPELLNRQNKKGECAKIPYDWTIYYLRKKALKEKIGNKELGWLLLHFNQKRGYYQLRDEEDDQKDNIEVLSLKISNVTRGEKDKKYEKYWYTIYFENGWTYDASFYSNIESWVNQTRDFIITTENLKDGSIKRRISSLPTFEEIDLMPEGVKKKFYAKIKLKTENEISKSHKTVGEYIYDVLLQKPQQKIKGKLVRTIERKFYKDELKQILQTQIRLNDTLKDPGLYRRCVEELYPHNLQHQSALLNKDFSYLFIEDILYYQRPLRSQKSSISNCSLESRTFILDGIKKTEPLKCIPRSHPLYQEFRLWQWISNLRIINKDSDADETANLVQSMEDVERLFDFLNGKKEIDQKTLLRHLKLKENVYRWNYVEDKKYPGNETHAMIAGRLDKVKGIPDSFLTGGKEEELWHIIYSVTDKIEYGKALKSFAIKNGLDAESFDGAFKKFPPFPSSYGSYSAKAVKKLLPLMRTGKYWNWDSIDTKTKGRIEKLITGEFDLEVKEKVREKTQKQLMHAENDFQGLPEWLAKYVVYDRHSERGETGKWETIAELEEYLKSFRQHSLKNPIVEQVMTETLRTVKDIWQYYGEGAENYFDEIHVELGREMKNPKNEREKIAKQNTTNENTNLRIKALLTEMLNDPDVENVRPYSPLQQDILKIYEDGVLNSDIELPEDIEKISRLPQPSGSELQRYKLWLEQKYRSPYTGAVIPLNKLFTPEYEIEHIIPQQRYYDDSFSNKIICESAVNKLKDNQTGLEFIQNHHGQIVELGFGKAGKIFNEEEYTDFVKQHYSKNRSKKTKLLALDVPEKMIERQLNDTRYISRFLLQVLSNIVRADEKDDGANSKHILASNGQITTNLKQHWGVDAIWNDLILPRFERLNQITNTTRFTVYNEKHQKNLPCVPLELQKGFQKKRIDHRHHAMDALVIACATRSHINFLNNQNALDKKKSKEQKMQDRHDLRTVLCDKKYNDGSNQNYQWIFKQPWGNFVLEAKEKLQHVVVSFKQNLRIINKATNKYIVIKNGEKVVEPQNGQNWAIRKPMHKDTISGLVSLRKIKTVSLSSGLDSSENIVNVRLKRYIQKLAAKGYDKKKITEHFKDNANHLNGSDVSKVQAYYWEHDNAASRVSLDSSFDQKRIDSITDTGIQKILLGHLKNNDNNPEMAFSAEGIEDMNKNIIALNGGKFHQAIFKVRTYEPMGNKFPVGTTGNKKGKFVEAAKGTNLFFAIYIDEKGRRSYETIPLNIAIERQKQGLTSVPATNAAGQNLLMHLSPNDLIYLPTEEEGSSSGPTDFSRSSNGIANRIYKMVSASGYQCFFIRHNVATPIVNKAEFSALNKMERSLDGAMIKEHCIKLSVDRLGNVKPASP